MTFPKLLKFAAAYFSILNLNCHLLFANGLNSRLMWTPHSSRVPFVIWRNFTFCIAVFWPASCAFSTFNFPICQFCCPQEWILFSSSKRVSRTNLLNSNRKLRPQLDRTRFRLSPTDLKELVCDVPLLYCFKEITPFYFSRIVAKAS